MNRGALIGDNKPGAQHGLSVFGMVFNSIHSDSCKVRILVCPLLL
jgi:hypothetical protein